MFLWLFLVYLNLRCDPTLGRLATLSAVVNQNPPADNSGKAKLVNTNYFPTAQSEDVSYHLAMGSRRVPDNDVRGSTEAWWRLGGALGLGNSLAHSTSVDAASYKSDCFALCHWN